MSNAILMNDLVRMARNGENQLAGRATQDPDVLSEVAFRDKHGISRADYAERERRRQREAIEDQILNSYRGDIPVDVVGDFRGIRGSRLEFARFKAWLDRTTAELSELESTKARLSDIVAAPERTAGGIAALVKRTAAFLIGKGGADDDSAERLELDKKLAAERHRAEAARQALVEVERQIEAKQLQLETLTSREAEFLNPAMQDLLEASGLPKLLARRRAEVAKLESIVALCDRNFPAGYGDERPAHPEACDFEWRHSWGEVAEALRSDARAEVGKLLPKVKA